MAVGPDAAEASGTDRLRRYLARCMAVTITSEDERASVQLDAEVPRDAKRLVLVDTEGREYHFGCGVWTPNGTFIHVATYTAQGRQSDVWWQDVREGLDRGCAIRDEPELGPLVSPLVNVALTGLARLCNQVNGFHAEPEKKWAIETLRAL